MDIPSISLLHPLVNQAFRIAYQELDLAQLRQQMDDLLDHLWSQSEDT